MGVVFIDADQITAFHSSSWDSAGLTAIAAALQWSHGTIYKTRLPDAPGPFGATESDIDGIRLFLPLLAQPPRLAQGKPLRRISDA